MDYNRLRVVIYVVVINHLLLVVYGALGGGVFRYHVRMHYFHARHKVGE